MKLWIRKNEDGSVTVREQDFNGATLHELSGNNYDEIDDELLLLVKTIQERG